jgi:hypothetical protein
MVSNFGSIIGIAVAPWHFDLSLVCLALGAGIVRVRPCSTWFPGSLSLNHETAGIFHVSGLHCLSWTINTLHSTLVPRARQRGLDLRDCFPGIQE